MYQQFYSLKRMIWFILTVVCLPSKQVQAHPIYANRTTDSLPCVITPPVLAADTLYACIFVYDTLVATASAGATVRWYDVDSGGTPLATGNELLIRPTTDSGTLYYYAEAELNGCISPRSKATVVLRLPPPIPATDFLNVCIRITSILTATAPEGVIIRWYDTPVDGFPIATGDTCYVWPAYDDVYHFYVTAEQNGCTSRRRQVTVRGHLPLPPPVVTPVDALGRFWGDTVTFTVTSPDTSVYTFNWHAAPDATVPIFTGNPFKVPVYYNTNYFVATAGEYCEGERRVLSASLPGARIMEPAADTRSLQMFPNPSNGVVRFTSGKKLYGSTVIVKDANGREVQREILQSNGINISKQPDGLYFIQVLTGKRELYTGKVLLRK